MGPEARIQRKAIDYARKLGVQEIRLVFRQGIRRGWPDVLFLIPGGRPLFIEFKAPGKKPTALQQQRIGELKRLGYDVFVIDNEDEACRAIAHAVDTARISAARG